MRLLRHSVPRNDKEGDVPRDDKEGDVPRDDKEGDVPRDDKKGDMPCNDRGGSLSSQLFWCHCEPKARQSRGKQNSKIKM